MLKAQKPSVSGEDFEKLNDRAKALMIRLESLQKNDSEKSELIMEDSNQKSDYLSEEKSENPPDGSLMKNLSNSKDQNDKPDLEDLARKFSTRD